MVITYHGGQCFKVTHGEMTLAFDPISKESKLDTVKFGADIAFISLNHPDFNGVSAVTYGAKEPFVINNAGEYEVDDVHVKAYGIPVTYAGTSRINTVYQVMLEGSNLVFLGALADAAIDPAILGELGDIDILFVPIGGGDVLEVPAASKLATKLEAKCIIPMHYDAAALKSFLKEEGAGQGKHVPQEKLTIKRKDFADMHGTIVVLAD